MKSDNLLHEQGFVDSLSQITVSLLIRALATGISQTGSGVGQFVFAPLATFLLTNYGWEAAVWVVAGLYLMCTLFGDLLRPLELKEGDEEEKPSSFKCWGTKSDTARQRISPFSRTDLFYRGTSSTLMRANTTTQGHVSSWDEFRHLLFLDPRYAQWLSKLYIPLPLYEVKYKYF